MNHQDPTEITLADVQAVLAEAGIDAPSYLEHTGGGCGTLMVGPFAERYSSYWQATDTYGTVCIGPGHYHAGTFNWGDLSVGLAADPESFMGNADTPARLVEAVRRGMAIYNDPTVSRMGPIFHRLWGDEPVTREMVESVSDPVRHAIAEVLETDARMKAERDGRPAAEWADFLRKAESDWVALNHPDADPDVLETWKAERAPLDDRTRPHRLFARMPDVDGWIATSFVADNGEAAEHLGRLLAGTDEFAGWVFEPRMVTGSDPSPFN